MMAIQSSVKEISCWYSSQKAMPGMTEGEKKGIGCEYTKMEEDHTQVFLLWNSYWSQQEHIMSIQLRITRLRSNMTYT
jgi:hypothetical protein